MNNDRSAWKRMEEYNRNDVVLLEKVYDKFKGWISNHPNHNHFSEERVCPSCASHKVQQRGYAVLTGGKYPRFQCQNCGSWFRGNKKVTTDKSEKFVKI
jgi:rubredoxin